MPEQFTSLIETMQGFALSSGLNILFAIVILAVGRWLAKMVANLLERTLKRTNIDETLVGFGRNLLFYAILAFAVVAALDRLGVETTSLVAALGAAGLAVGLALQGSLANFASGVLILLFRPFRVGQLVELAGTLGHVKEIQIFNTILITLDNKTVIIPNNNVTSDVIVNYSAEGHIRLDLVFGIGYGDDLLKAKGVLEELVNADARVLDDPAPTVAVLELGDSSVNFAVRPYVKVEDYWGVYFAMHEAVKLRFDAEGISIPFPQRDVHLFQQE